MRISPLAERLERWLSYNAGIGPHLTYLAVHPDDYYPGKQGQKSAAEKLGYRYAGLPIYPLGNTP